MNREDKEITRGKELTADLEGNERALSRLITLVENNPESAYEIMPLIHPNLGRGHSIGFTGPPGAGKSSLVNQVIRLLREQDKKVGIIAIDPSSPFSRGAFLGDRIRMQKHYTDPGVFIRSMATRGSHGGLAGTTKHVIKLMDAFGADFILVETVGVGQTELDIVQTTETTVVVLVPEGGDSIQAMKAGLVEIGDIFVVNKADRPNAEDVSVQLEMILGMNPRYVHNMPPIILTEAVNGVGIDRVVGSIQELQKRKLADGEIENHHRQRRKREFEELLSESAVKEFTSCIENDSRLQESIDKVLDGTVDPHSAIREIFPECILARS
ncbi:methylmalonyl Co-A mutase-associated GTPase MeaB [Thermodesulfobacteriota bacterium]